MLSAVQNNDRAETDDSVITNVVDDLSLVLKLDNVSKLNKFWGVLSFKIHWEVSRHKLRYLLKTFAYLQKKMLNFKNDVFVVFTQSKLVFSFDVLILFSCAKIE